MHHDTLHFLTSDVPTGHARRPPRPHDGDTTGARPLPPPSHDKVRFVAVSDTHSHPDWCRDVPHGDVFIHCGDLTRGGTVSQLNTVFAEIAALPHPHKIVIAGNHDLSLDPRFCKHHESTLLKHGLDRASATRVRDLWLGPEAKAASITFLHHESMHLNVRGHAFTIFGSPYTPDFCDWAFMYPVSQDIWASAVPRRDSKTKQVWVTHGPAQGILDSVVDIGPVGCPWLHAQLLLQQPNAHFFGHIHEGAAIGLHETHHGDGTTTRSVNAAMLDEKYRLAYPATVLDL